MFKNIFLPLFICIQQNKKIRVTILTFNDFKRQLMTKKTLIRTLLKLIRILVTVHLNSKNHRNTCVGRITEVFLTFEIKITGCALHFFRASAVDSKVQRYCMLIIFNYYIKINFRSLLLFCCVVSRCIMRL